jgi:hypothetical protein
MAVILKVESSPRLLVYKVALQGGRDGIEHLVRDQEFCSRSKTGGSNFAGSASERGRMAYQFALHGRDSIDVNDLDSALRSIGLFGCELPPRSEHHLDGAHC